MADYLDAQRTSPTGALPEIHAPELPPAFASGAHNNNLFPSNLPSLVVEFLNILQHLREQILAAPLFSPE